VGSEAVRRWAREGFDVVGIDNDMRASFFGPDASTAGNRHRLEREVKSYTHFDCDVSDAAAVKDVASRFGKSVACVIHAAAQPSHDWATRNPSLDFAVNAVGTLNMLEATRSYFPDACFIFTSTNKVYGDRPNSLPLREFETRYELDESDTWSARGIDETMSIDATKHSIFGASKVAADIMVQEYGRYFGLKTVCFRGGCLTGANHAGTELHGFLSYLVKCVATGRPYTICGYKGKQVRDNIHSVDLIDAFWHVFKAPRPGEVYNIGGGRFANVSVLEAFEIAKQVTGRTFTPAYSDQARAGDHMWWISSVDKFRSHYPAWNYTYSIKDTIEDIAGAYGSHLR